MSINKFSLQKRLKSFGFAFNGLKILFLEEHNSRIHFTATIITVLTGFLLKISAYEWIVILLAIGLVITLEIVNSSVERIADLISPEKNEIIKKIKDLSAAAVLISSITALAIGIIIFLPKLLFR